MKLLVAALESELIAFPNPLAGFDRLVTGPGKLKSTYSLTRALDAAPYEEILVVGTAGALDPELDAGVYDVDAAFQHDVIDEEGVAGQHVSMPTRMVLGEGDMVIATGDSFIDDADAVLAIRALGGRLVDMESYSYAWVAAQFGVPIRIWKAISDRAQATSPLPLYTRAEARMLGIRLDAPRWHRVCKGVYVDGEQYRALPDWKRYAVRVHAYVRTHPDAILCLESAGVIHGIPQFGETARIHVYDPDGAASQKYGDIRVHTSHNARQIESIDGMLVTSLLDTVVDLSRVMNPADALAVVDAAISPVQEGPLQIDALIARSAEFESRRGRARMRWVGEHADRMAESPAESISRAVILWSGYEVPELQREFQYEGFLDRTDFYFPSCRGIGESDGWAKYELDDPEKASKRLREEKRREDRLRRHRHPFARWDLGDAWKVSPLCEALDGAGVPRVGHPQPAMLATLKSRPRAKPWRRNSA